MTYRLHGFMLEKIKGSFVYVIDGKETTCDDPHDLLRQSFDKDYVVDAIEARDNTVVVTLKENDIVPNDLNADWAKEHMKTTGEEISFF